MVLLNQLGSRWSFADTSASTARGSFPLNVARRLAFLCGPIVAVLLGNSLTCMVWVLWYFALATCSCQRHSQLVYSTVWGLALIVSTWLPRAVQMFLQQWVSYVVVVCSLCRRPWFPYFHAIQLWLQPGLDENPAGSAS